MNLPVIYAWFCFIAAIIGFVLYIVHPSFFVRERVTAGGAALGAVLSLLSLVFFGNYLGLF